MPKRLDRQKAKRDFLKHQSPTVKGRWKEFSKKAGRTHTYDRVQKATRGRSVEKANLEALATDKAQKEVIEETVAEIKEMYKPSKEVLSEIHEGIVGLIQYGVESLKKRAEKEEVLNPKEIKDYWEMTKGEKLEPTRVTKVDADGLQNGPSVIIVSQDVSGILGK